MTQGNSAIYLIGGLGLVAAAAALMATDRAGASAPPAPTGDPLHPPWGDPNDAVLQARKRLLDASMPYQTPDYPRLLGGSPAPAITIPSHAVQVMTPADGGGSSTPAAPATPATPATPAAKAAELQSMLDDLTGKKSTPATMTPAGPSSPPPPATVTPTTPTPSGRTSKQAAQALRDWVNAALKSGNDAALGSSKAPNDTVAIAQRDMRLIVSDGVYGPKTAARGKELLGVEFPSRTKRRTAATATPTPTLSIPVPPATDISVNKHSPIEAANALLVLLNASAPSTWGTRAQPNDVIAKAQADMGGIVADGIYGAKTQARGRALTGKTFPTRK